MVDLDLRKLSAPIEELRPKLDAAYKRLDAQWGEIEACLKKLPIPCDVSYAYSEDPWQPEDCNCLEWKKWNGKKRICIVAYHINPQSSDYDETTTPYDEWSGEQRIEMLEHVPGLFDAVAKQTKEFIDRAKN